MPFSLILVLKLGKEYLNFLKELLKNLMKMIRKSGKELCQGKDKLKVLLKIKNKQIFFVEI